MREQNRRFLGHMSYCNVYCTFGIFEFKVGLGIYGYDAVFI